MSRILDQYDGARLRCQPRVLTYRVTCSDGTKANEKFTEAQAAEHGTVLESDGVPLDVAIRMVEQWNAAAKRQGSSLRYAIPFVKGPQA